MKKIALISFLLFSLIIKSQTIDYAAIKKAVVSSYPEIDFNNRLLIISVWNSTDVLSRDMNKEFYRTYQVYRNAKLTGGVKGVIFISISNDTNEMNFKIAEKKDGLNYEFTMSDFKGYVSNSKLANMQLDKSISNIVFDTNGKLVYQNLETTTIFKSFNTLITR